MGLKKKQRTVEWLQSQVDQEVAERVDKAISKSKETVEEKKDDIVSESEK